MSRTPHSHARRAHSQETPCGRVRSRAGWGRRTGWTRLLRRAWRTIDPSLRLIESGCLTEATERPLRGRLTAGATHLHALRRRLRSPLMMDGAVRRISRGRAPPPVAIRRLFSHCKSRTKEKESVR